MTAVIFSKALQAKLGTVIFVLRAVAVNCKVTNIMYSSSSTSLLNIVVLKLSLSRCINISFVYFIASFLLKQFSAYMWFRTIQCYKSIMSCPKISWYEFKWFMMIFINYKRICGSLKIYSYRNYFCSHYRRKLFYHTNDALYNLYLASTQIVD